jgi:hypothetical protein
MTPERKVELRASAAKARIYSSPLGMFGAYLAECLDEIERLQNVLKLTDAECMAGGFCRGIAIRKENEPLTEFDREMLTIAGKCIARIINQQEAK